MKKISTQKHLLTGTSALALAAVSAAALPSQAFAAWGSITASTVVAQAAAGNGEVLSVTGAGNLAVPGAIAATNSNKTGTKISVNTTSATDGISSTGNFSAIAVTGTGTLVNLDNTKGTITGAGTDAAHATVFIDGADADLAIVNAGTLSNTGAGGVALNIGASNVNKVTLNNSGSIISTGSAASDAINVGDKATATFALTNTGTITAGASGNAIKIAAGGNTVATITNTSGTITGGVDLGAASTSKIDLNGGIIAGTVTLGDSGQALNLAGGQVNGAIAGTGAVNAKVDYTTNGAVTGTTLAITDGTTFNTATNNNAVTAKTTLGSGATGATWTVGTGVITGAIDANTAGKGTINFTASNVLGVGTKIGATTGLATINIADGTTLNAATNNVTLKATNIYLGTTTGSTLTLGTGAVTGAIDAKTANTGTINFNGSQTNAATIGGTTGIAAINVANGAAVVMNADAKAITTTVGGGTSGSMTLNAGKTITGVVNINDGATFTQQTTGVVTGVVNGVVANKGTYAISTAGTFTSNNAIGATTGLAAFTTGDNTTVNLAHNVKATTTTIGGGGAAATLNQTDGLITGNVLIAQSGVYNLSGGTGFTGTLDGAANNTGNVLNIKTAFTSPSTIGSANGISALNVSTGGTLTLGGDVKATTTTVSAGGTLNIGTTARTITGALTGTGTGIINAGTKIQTLTGNLTTAATNTLGFSIVDNAAGSYGRIASGGTVALTAGTLVTIDTSTAKSFITNGTKYLIISGTNADDNAITITGSSTNFLTFASDATTNNEMSVKATRAATYQSVVTNRNAQSIGTALTTLGNNTDVNISAFQGRLDGTTTVAQANAALAEVTPQIQATSVMSSNAVQKSLDVVSARGSDLRAGIDSSVNSGMTAGNAVADKGIWAQAFGTTATQDFRDGVNGYDADTYGFAVGADKVVGDHSRLGASVSYANTTVDSNGSAIQNTDIDTYQVNLYGFHDMGKWYADGLVGFAWQNYNSDRFISSPAATANGDYDGQTYTVRANTGYRLTAGNGIDIIPNGGLTYLNNQISGYTETGAGGLNLRVSDYDSQALFGRVGFDVAKDFNSNGMIVRPTVRAAYLYDFIGDEASTNALFTGGGGTFRVQDASPARSSFNVGASLNVVTTKNVTLSADYDYLAKSDYDSHSGMLRARFGF